MSSDDSFIDYVTKMDKKAKRPMPMHGRGIITTLLPTIAKRAKPATKKGKKAGKK